MIRVAVRALLLSGAAAALALAVRDPLARRLLPQLAGPTAALAHAARGVSPRPRVGAPPPAPPPFVVPRASVEQALPLAPVSGKPSPGPHASKPSSGAHIVTRKQLEDALANGLPGASALAVKDEDGKPAGLRLSGVSRLASFGVRDGDVLVSANGLPLRNGDEALAALGALKDAQRVVVVLRRGAGAYSVPVELAD